MRMLPLLNYKHILHPKDTNKEKNFTSKQYPFPQTSHNLHPFPTFNQNTNGKKESEESKEIERN